MFNEITMVLSKDNRLENCNLRKPGKGHAGVFFKLSKQNNIFFRLLNNLFAHDNILFRQLNIMFAQLNILFGQLYILFGQLRLQSIRCIAINMNQLISMFN